MNHPTQKNDTGAARSQRVLSGPAETDPSDLKSPAAGSIFADYYRSPHSSVESKHRDEIFDLDVGQLSWNFASDFLSFGHRMDLGPSARWVDLGCGFGGPTLFMHSRFGGEVIGLDVNSKAIEHASDCASRAGLQDKVHFQVVQPNQILPLEDSSCDGVFINDAICHFPDRAKTLKDCFRVLRSGGKIVILDPLVVTGVISNIEVFNRNALVPYFYAPVGYTDRLLGEAGFRDVVVENSTARLVEFCNRWLALREKLKEELIVEDADGFERINDQLRCVLVTSSEGRLSRMNYFATK